jgi:hypothetical protein
MSHISIPTRSGGTLESTAEAVDLQLALSPAPAVMSATVLPNTISISHIFLDSFSGGAPSVDPDPVEDGTEFFGVSSMHLGLGGAPPYITGYPLGGV